MQLPIAMTNANANSYEECNCQNLWQIIFEISITNVVQIAMRNTINIRYDKCKCQYLTNAITNSYDMQMSIAMTNAIANTYDKCNCQ